MKARQFYPVDNIRLLSLSALKSYLSVGDKTARRIGREAGAVIEIGTRKLYDKIVIDKYVDTLRGKDDEE